MGFKTLFPNVEQVIACPGCGTRTMALQKVSPAIFLPGMFAQYACKACDASDATFVSSVTDVGLQPARARRAARG